MVKLRSLRNILIIVAIVVAIIVLLSALQTSRDHQAIGSRGRDLVHGPFATIAFEVDYETGTNPDRAQWDRTLDFVHRYTGKLAIATFTEVPKQRSSYTIDEAVAYSNSVRNQFSFIVGVLSVHYLYINNAGTCIALCATTAAFTYDASDAVVYANVVGSSIEAAVTSHEFAHMMGLMCITYSASLDSKCDGSGHSTDKTSLMAPVLNPGSPWVQTLTLQPNEVNDLQNYV